MNNYMHILIGMFQHKGKINYVGEGGKLSLKRLLSVLSDGICAQHTLLIHSNKKKSGG